MYKTKTLFSGYSLGLKDNNLYVAIPEKSFTNGKVIVEHNNEVRKFERSKSKFVRTFDDKFRVGQTYNLVYYKW